MPADPQAQYSQGQIIDVDVVLTAHHKGHFEFFACPIDYGDIPPGDCFEQYPLEFVEDPLYGAPQDVNYPERAYIAPRGVALTDNTGVAGDFYRFRLKLPASLSGDLVLLQWHYKTANSCVFTGYDEYPFPAAWGNMRSNLGLCGPIPEDGRGVPEQFWNCAEISIAAGPVTPTTPAPVPAPSPPTNPYTTAPIPSPDFNGGCGDGIVGNGICSNPFLCCSSHGFCGTTDAYCNEKPRPSPDTGASAIESSMPWEEWVFSTNPRCGTTEADARSNCRQTCTNSIDCPSGHICWPVHSNYCGSKPQSTTECSNAPKGGFRCGVTELVARETCGKTCSNDTECGSGEYCFTLHDNLCDCENGRMLRGGKSKKR